MLPRILPSAVASISAAYVAHSEANTPEGLKLDPQKLSKLDASHLNKTANRLFSVPLLQSMRAAGAERALNKEVGAQFVTEKSFVAYRGCYNIPGKEEASAHEIQNHFFKNGFLPATFSEGNPHHTDKGSLFKRLTGIDQNSPYIYDSEKKNHWMQGGTGGLVSMSVDMNKAETYAAGTGCVFVIAPERYCNTADHNSREGKPDIDIKDQNEFEVVSTHIPRERVIAAYTINDDNEITNLILNPYRDPALAKEAKIDLPSTAKLGKHLETLQSAGVKPDPLKDHISDFLKRLRPD